MATNSCDDVSATSDRDRPPNVTSDNEGIRHEKSLQLCRNRSAAKANVTMKIKEVTECMSNSRDVADVEWKAKKNLETATLWHFRGIHSAYHASLEDEFEIQDSLVSLAERCVTSKKTAAREISICYEQDVFNGDY